MTLLMCVIQWINTGILISAAIFIAGYLWQTWHDRAVSAMVIFIASIVALEAIAGYALRFLSPITYLVIILVGCSMIFFFLKNKNGFFKIFKKRQIIKKEKMAFGVIDRVLLVMLVILGIYELFCIILFPEFGWDSIVYHITNLPYWHQNKNLLPYPTSAEYATFSPLNVALLNYWFFQLLNIDLIIELPGLLFAFLAFLSVYGISRELRVPAKNAVWAAGFFVCMPIVVETAKYCLADMPMAALFLCAIYIRLRLEKSPGVANAYMLCAVLGLLAGTKILGGVLSFFVLLSLLQKKWLIYLKENYVNAAILFLVMILTGGFWYIKNIFLFQNPIYPQEVSLFTNVILPGKEVGNVSSSWQDFILNIKGLGRIIDGKQYLVSETSGWGGQAFVFLLPTSVFALWLFIKSYYLRRKIVLTALLFITPFILFLMIVAPYPWWFKYVIWFPGAIAIAFGGLITKFKSDILKIIILCIFAVSITISLGLGAFVDKGRFKTFIRLPIPLNATAIYGNNMPTPNPFAFIYKLPGVQTIGYYYKGADNYIYPLFDNKYARKVELYQGKTDSKQEIDLFIKNKNIDIFYTNDENMAGTLREIEILQEMQKNVFQKKYR